MSTEAKQYRITVPQISGSGFQFNVPVGGVVFGIGANGTGKSSFVSLLSKNSTNVTRLKGNREITLSSSAVGITGATRNQYQQYFLNDLKQDATRYFSPNSRNMTESILYDLKEAESHFISKQHEKLLASNASSPDEISAINDIRTKISPLKKVQDVLGSGGIDYTFSYDQRGQLTASKLNSPTATINVMSDGERAAFLLTAKVIIAPAGQLILLDEPERHLHRSISSPLINSLINMRRDCAFMIVTHDLTLPRDFPDSEILLFKEYRHPSKWRLENLQEINRIPVEIAETILGSKDRILFVEGKENSLDNNLYASLYGNCTVIPSENCASVINLTKGVNKSKTLHGVTATGFVDNDGMISEKCEKLAKENVMAIGVNSVESLYYHPEIITRVVAHLRDTGFTIIDNFEDVLKLQILSAFEREKDTLILQSQTRRLRELSMTSLPTPRALKDSAAWGIDHSNALVQKVMDEEDNKIKKLIEAENHVRLIEQYPLKRAGIADKISKVMGLANCGVYEDMVRTLSRRDETFATKLREIIGVTNLN